MGAFPRIKAALIGCGAISEKYLTNITQKFHVLELVGCSDLIPERSEKRAAEYGLQQMTNQEIYENPEIQIVLNTTYPLSHYEVTKAALLAGKHVYTEKMLAVTLEEGQELVALAKERGLLFTAAPDTFLGSGWQTARKLLDDGMIGEPVAAFGVCIRSYQDYGETDTQPKPFVFAPGGGIPFDMGGYYLHNMINLFGGIARVAGFARTRNPERTYQNPRHPRFGEQFSVETPNTMGASLEFQNGTIANLTITSEAAVFPTPYFEVHGSEGSLTLFDPNDFGGKILLRRNTTETAVEMPILYPYGEECRGIGAADMAYALLQGKKPRVDAEVGLHAFEAVHGILKSCADSKVHQMQSACARPQPLPLIPAAGTGYEAMWAAEMAEK